MSKANAEWWDQETADKLRVTTSKRVRKPNSFYDTGDEETTASKSAPKKSKRAPSSNNVTELPAANDATDDVSPSLSASPSANQAYNDNTNAPTTTAPNSSPPIRSNFTGVDPSSDTQSQSAQDVTVSHATATSDDRNTNKATEDVTTNFTNVGLPSLPPVVLGSISSEGRYKSLNARWFGCKSKKPTPVETVEIASGGRCLISRDTLVKFRVKRGKNESVECFRVLGIFSKHYNKWFIHWDSDEVEYVPNSKKYKIMARMVTLDGRNCYKEVDLTADGQWDTKSVFTLRHMADVVGIEGVLDASSSIAW